MIEVVPRARLELARGFPHCPLKTACLPIPPPRHGKAAVNRGLSPYSRVRAASLPTVSKCYQPLASGGHRRGLEVAEALVRVEHPGLDVLDDVGMVEFLEHFEFLESKSEVDGIFLHLFLRSERFFVGSSMNFKYLSKSALAQ